jgi:Kelch motif protein
VRRVAIAAALAILLVAAIGGIAATRDVPVRSWLGLHEKLTPCMPTAASVRLPPGARSPAGSWETVTQLPQAQDELRAATIGEIVFVGSGLEPGETELGLSSVDILYAFEPGTGAFRRLPDLPRRVDHPAVVAYAGELYVAGGWHDIEPTDAVWKYTPENSSWTELPPLGVARGAAAGAVVDGRLYVVGGSTHSHSGDVTPTGVVEVYDFATGRWSRGPDLPTPRHHHGVAELDGRVWAVGGRGDTDVSLDTVEVFDPSSGRWTEGPRLPFGAGGLSLDNVSGKLVAAGGGDDDEGWVTPATWALGASDPSWTRLADLSVPRHGHGSAAVGDKLYVFGGAPCPGYGRTASVEGLQVPN